MQPVQFSGILIKLNGERAVQSIAAYNQPYKSSFMDVKPIGLGDIAVRPMGKPWTLVVEGDKEVERVCRGISTAKASDSEGAVTDLAADALAAYDHRITMPLYFNLQHNGLATNPPNYLGHKTHELRFAPSGLGYDSGGGPSTSAGAPQPRMRPDGLLEREAAVSATTSTRTRRSS